MLDNKDVNELLEILENHDDEELAVKLLKEFNLATKRLGKLMLNLDATLPHDQWKNECDLAQLSLDNIIKEIKSL